VAKEKQNPNGVPIYMNNIKIVHEILKVKMNSGLYGHQLPMGRMKLRPL